MKLSLNKKVVSQSDSVKITETPTGKLSASKQKNIYAVDPVKVAQEVFPKVNQKFCSNQGLNQLFNVLNQHVTNKMHGGAKGNTENVEGLTFSEVFELIFLETQKKEYVSILSEEAIKLFFDAATQRFTKVSKDSTKAVDLSHDEMQKVKKEKAMDSTLTGILGGGGLL